MPNRTLNVILSATDATLTSTLRRAGAEVSTFSNGVNAASTRVVSSTDMIGKGFLAVGAIAAVALAAGVKGAVELEAAMRNVATISPFVRQNIGGVTDAVVEMSTHLPQSAKVLAEGLYDVASSGFAGKESMVVLDVSARAASAGLTDTATSARAITGVLNAYGLSAEDARHVSDVLFQTVNLGVITFEELAQHIGAVLGIASAAKIPIEEVGAAIAQITRAGIPAAEATTALNRTITSTIDPSEALNVVLHDMGYESGAAALETDGLQGFMMKLRDRVGDNITTWQQLFPEVRALKGALALTAGEGKGWVDILHQMDDATRGVGATQRALNEQQKSFAYQWQITKNQISAVLMDIGEELIPVLKTAASVLRIFVDGWVALPGPIKSALIVLALVAGSLRLLGPLLERFFLQMSLGAASAGASTAGITAVHTAMSGLAAKLPMIIAGVSIAAVGFQLAGEEGAKGAVGILAMTGGLAMVGFQLGGPWGAAIGAGVGLIAGLTKHFVDGGKSAKEYADDIKSVSKEIQGLSNTQSLMRFFDALDKGSKFGFIAGDIRSITNELNTLAKVDPVGAERVFSAMKAMRDDVGRPAFNVKEIELAQLAMDRAALSVSHHSDKEAEATGVAQRAALANLGNADSLLEVANSAQAAALAIKDVTEAQIKMLGGQLAIDQAMLDLGEAQDDYNVAVYLHGVNSEEARQADIKRQQAVLDLMGATNTLEQSEAALIERYKAVPQELDAQIKKYEDMKAANPLFAASFDPILTKLYGLRDTIANLPKEIPPIKTDADTAGTNSKLDETKRKADELDAKKPKPKADIDVGDAWYKIDETKRKLDNVHNTRVVPYVDADTANAQSKLNGVQGTLAAIVGFHQVTVDVAITGAADALFHVNVAEGGIFRSNVQTFARGGEHHVAQIGRSGSSNVTRVWNEPETDGESYIPWSTAKRARSLQILRITANAFGQQVVPMAGGGGFFGPSGGTMTTPSGITIVIQGNVYGDTAFKRMMQVEVDKRNRHSGIALARKGR